MFRLQAAGNDAESKLSSISHCSWQYPTTEQDADKGCGEGSVCVKPNVLRYLRSRELSPRYHNVLSASALASASASKPSPNKRNQSLSNASPNNMHAHCQEQCLETKPMAVQNCSLGKSLADLILDIDDRLPDEPQSIFTAASGWTHPRTGGFIVSNNRQQETRSDTSAPPSLLRHESVTSWVSAIHRPLASLWPFALSTIVNTSHAPSAEAQQSSASNNQQQTNFSQNHHHDDAYKTDPVSIHKELVYSSMFERLDDYIARKLPAALRETEFYMPNNDKIFASVWLSDDEVVVGTKCSKLIVLNTVTGKRTDIPSFVISTVIPTITDAATRSVLGRSLPSNINSQIQQQVTTPRPNANTGQLLVQNCAGIHSIAINPSRSLIAVGGSKPNESIQIFQLPTFEPYALLRGHRDVVFSVAWVSDTVLISGSRDTHLMLWKLEQQYQTSTLYPHPFSHPVPIFAPASSHKEHAGKVRDLVYDQQTHQASTLSSDGFVKIWDVKHRSCHVTLSVPLIHTNETVCLTLDPIHHITAVGSQSNISLIDPRSGSIVHNFESCDDGWGVRSMSIDRGVLTVGGGLGRISFYDLRVQKYIGWQSQARRKHNQDTSDRNMQEYLFSMNGEIPSVDDRHALDPLGFRNQSRQVSSAANGPMSLRGDGGIDHRCLMAGKGWLCRDQIYLSHFQGIDVRNAVYTLGYHDSGRRLFAAGGPLQLNLQGSYAGIWQ